MSSPIEQRPSKTADRHHLPPPHPLADDRAGWIARGLILALALFTFLPALRNGLLPWDDAGNITRHPHLQSLNVSSLASIWSGPYDGMYVPMVYTSFFLEKALAGKEEAALAQLVHFDNLVLHALAALVVFEILRRLLTLRHGETRATVPAACVGAVLFAVHPLQAEAVSWATGRKDLFAGLLGLLSVWQYLAWRGNGRRRHYVAASGLFLAALLSKPAAAALPLAALALDFYALRLPLRRSLVALSPWAAGSLIAAVATSGLQADAAADPTAPFWTRPFVAADSLAFYLEKIFLPMNLSPVYDRTLEFVVANRMLLLLALPLVALPLGWALSRRNLAGAGAAWALAMLLPASGIVPFHYQSISTVADRYFYVSMAGIGLLAAAGLHQLTARSRRPVPVHWIAAPVLIALAALSWRQSRIWRSSETLWTSAVAVAPGSAVVRNNLGMTYAEQGKQAEAVREWEEAVRLQPGFASAQNNLGNYYSATGQPEKALEHYRKAVEADPSHVVARSNLIVLHRQAGRNDEATSEAQVLLKHDPDNVLALNLVVISLGMSGRGSEAIQLLRDAVARQPGNAELKTLLQQAEQILASEKPPTP